jgi:hypothetical protein
MALQIQITQARCRHQLLLVVLAVLEAAGLATAR